MNKYALIIGVGQRSEDAPAMSITAKDAIRVSTELKNRCNIKIEDIVLLIEKDATRKNVFAAIEDLINKTQTNEAEIVWVYFSGHGCQIVNTTNTTHFLITNDTTNTNLENSAIEGTDFVNKLNNINAKKMILLLDCCHAGGINIKRSNLPFDSEQFLSRSNRVVIASSHSEEVSFTSQPLSVFTYVFVNGLAGTYFGKNDNDVTVFDLAMYIREFVYPLTKRKQRPQLSLINRETENFTLVSYPNGKPIFPAFDSEFKLSDGYGKAIDLEIPIVHDDKYREQFEWFKLNSEKKIKNSISTSVIKGDENLVMQNIKGSQISININKKS